MTIPHGETTLYIARHGETDWNVKGILQGQMDIELNEAGERQARLLADEFAHIRFDAIFSSDLIRARRTAEIIGEVQKLRIATSKLLRERKFGKYEGMLVDVFREENRKLLAYMKSLPKEKMWKYKLAQDIESNEEIGDRFRAFVRRVASGYASKAVLAVTHGSIIRTFLMHIGWATPQTLPSGSIGNAAYVKCIFDGKNYFIKKVKGICEV